MKKINEKCGVFGAINVSNISNKIYVGLHYLQHRGQDGCGVSIFDNKNNKLNTIVKKGILSQNLNYELIRNLVGFGGIGHVLYSIKRDISKCNIQPFEFITIDNQKFSLVHNGNLVNNKFLLKYFKENNIKVNKTSDSEYIGLLIKHSKKKNFKEKILEALTYIKGAYSLLILTKNNIFAIRDNHGIRPLSIASLEKGFLISSESCAFFPLNAKFIEDVKPGEIVTFFNDKKTYEKEFFSQKRYNHLDAMELVYFARPDSNLDGINVHNFRKKSGVLLAKQEKSKKNFNKEVDVVIPVPDSSISASIGYSKEMDIPYDIGLIKHKFWGRNFIQPTKKKRICGAMMKLSIVESVIRDKNIILVDDSIVRGDTIKYIISLLKKNGAKKVHVKITSPIIKFPNYYGISILTKEELIANKFKNIEDIVKEINCDSLEYLTIENFKKLFDKNFGCFDIFTGEYPIKIEDKEN